MKKLIGMGIVALPMVLVACGNTEAPAPQEGEEGQPGEKLTVVTTFYPMYEFTAQVSGDAADVSMLIPSGTDSHGFEPSAQDVAAISDADVFVYSSEEMETWVPDLLPIVADEEVLVIEASQNIELMESGEDHEEDDHGHSHVLDPHVWVDPVYAQEQVQTIEEGLIEADPENETTYKEQAADYISELEELHQEFSGAFEGAEQRTFVTQHAAFGYLAERYDLTQLSIGGLSTESEPDPASLAGVTTFVRENDIPVIYYNQSSSSAIAETVAEEAGVETAQLHSIEGVSEEEQAEGADYLSLMRSNLEALKRSIH